MQMFSHLSAQSVGKASGLTFIGRVILKRFMGQTTVKSMPVTDVTKHSIVGLICTSIGLGTDTGTMLINLKPNRSVRLTVTNSE